MKCDLHFWMGIGVIWGLWQREETDVEKEEELSLRNIRGNAVEGYGAE